MKATNIIFIVLIVISAILAGSLVSCTGEVDDHESIVANYEERISELEATNNNLRDENEILAQKVADLQQKEKNYLRVQEQLYEIADITKSNKKPSSNVELDPDYATNQSLETLEKNQNELLKLRKERGLLYAEINSLKDNLNTSSPNKEKIQAQIARLQASLDKTDVMIANLEESIANSQSLIDSQENEINTIYYVIGGKKELREMGITSKEGGVLWGLLGSTETVTNDFDPSYFIPKNLAENDEIEINAYIYDVTIHTKQHKSAYELIEVSNELTILKVKDHEQFRKDKHLVIEIN